MKQWISRSQSMSVRVASRSGSARPGAPPAPIWAVADSWRGVYRRRDAPVRPSFGGEAALEREGLPSLVISTIVPDSGEWRHARGATADGNDCSRSHRRVLSDEPSRPGRGGDAGTDGR